VVAATSWWLHLADSWVCINVTEVLVLRARYVELILAYSELAIRTQSYPNPPKKNMFLGFKKKY
jgi:hypothetical protein